MKLIVKGEVDEFEVNFRTMNVNELEIFNTTPSEYVYDLVDALMFKTDSNLLPIMSERITPAGIYNNLLRMKYKVTPDQEFKIQYDKWLKNQKNIKPNPDVVY